MRQRSDFFQRRRGFTLVELLVAMAVFAILVVLLASFLSSLLAVNQQSQSRLDTDDQARTVVDRIEQDLSQVVQSNDVDFYTDKSAVNDRFFFYAETPGYPAGSTTPSDASLVGYRVNSTSSSASYNQLERYSVALSWDGSGSNSMPFLSYSSATSAVPLASTLLISNPVTAFNSTDSNYHVIGPGVFRMEICYQLKDGTYSINPILTATPTSWPAGATFYTSQSSPPDSTKCLPTYVAGSRWFDESANRGYICVNPASPAVWRSAGQQDVSAIIVTLATLDTADRLLLQTQGKDLSTVAALFTKAKNTDLQASTPVLPATKWFQVINSQGLLSLLPTKAAAAVRVYQRFLYLNINSSS